MSFTPTEEQAKINELVAGGGPVVVQAGAGTGKTTQFTMIHETLADQGRVGLYTSFNKDVSKSVRFPRGNVMVATFHSLCYRLALRHSGMAPLLPRLNHGATRSELPYVMGVDKIDYSYETYSGMEKELLGLGSQTYPRMEPAHIAQNVLATIRKWCASADEAITTAHVPLVTGMTRQWHDEDYAPKIADLAARVWSEDICQPTGRVRLEHDHYLKMISLTTPQFSEHFGLGGGVLMFDEAQDARPAMTHLVRSQIDMQPVAVGDSAQAIYGFTGARDALPTFAASPGAHTATLSTSWRFGDEVAAWANPLLENIGSPLVLAGNPNRTTEVVVSHRRVADTDAVLVRTNAQLLEEAEFELRAGRKVALSLDSKMVPMVIRDIRSIECGRTPFLTELNGYSSLDEIIEAVNMSSADSPVLSLAGFIARVGADVAERIVNSSVDETEADVMITTIHKAKGRQWDSVRIAMTPSDAVPGLGDDGKLDTEPLMLSYVAITRARSRLVLPDDVVDALYGGSV